MGISVTIYTTPTCPDCHALKRWFEAQGASYGERDLTHPAVMEEAKARTGMRVAPITFVGDRFFYGTYGEQRPKIAVALGQLSNPAGEGAHP